MDFIQAVTCWGRLLDCYQTLRQGYIQTGAFSVSLEACHFTACTMHAQLQHAHFCINPLTLYIVMDDL